MDRKGKAKARKRGVAADLALKRGGGVKGGQLSKPPVKSITLENVQITS
jgi:hypothetical protein